MPPDEKASTSLVALGDAREQVIARLSDAFAHDVIDVDEFERRLAIAHRTESIAEVSALASDLGAEEALPASIAVAPAATLASPREADRVLAIFGGVERRGMWTLPRQLRVTAIMGGIVLDFREAVLAPGVTDVHATAFLGGIEIIVPPSLAVEVSGTAIMGGFGHVERRPTSPDPARPLLRVHGLAVMGGVAIETRLPGESESEAHKRRHREGRHLGRASDAKLLPREARR